MTFDINEGHYHVKLASAVLLTKFGSSGVTLIEGARGQRMAGCVID